MTEPSRRRVSYNQLEALWEILNKRRDIALGYNKTSQAREFARRMWDQVAVALNSQGDGAMKDAKGWSKYWNDYKSKLKKLVAAQRISNEQTGGGPSTVKPLEEIEKKFLQILGENFGFGLPGARVEPFEDATQTERCTPVESSMHPVYSSGATSDQPRSAWDHDQPGPSWRAIPQQGSLTNHDDQPGPSWRATPQQGSLMDHDQPWPLLRVTPPQGSLMDRDQPWPLLRVTPPQGSLMDRDQPGPLLRVTPPHLPTTPSPVHGTPPRINTPPPEVSPRRRRRPRRERPMTAEAARRALVEISQRRADIDERNSSTLRELTDAVKEMKEMLRRFIETPRGGE